MGAKVYSQAVIETSPIVHAVRKLQGKDKASLEVKFSITYYLAKRERSFNGLPPFDNIRKKEPHKTLVTVMLPIELLQYL